MHPTATQNVGDCYPTAVP